MPLYPILTVFNTALQSYTFLEILHFLLTYQHIPQNTQYRDHHHSHQFLSPVVLTSSFPYLVQTHTPGSITQKANKPISMFLQRRNKPKYPQEANTEKAYKRHADIVLGWIRTQQPSAVSQQCQPLRQQAVQIGKNKWILAKEITSLSRELCRFPL